MDGTPAHHEYGVSEDLYLPLVTAPTAPQEHIGRGSGLAENHIHGVAAQDISHEGGAHSAFVKDEARGIQLSPRGGASGGVEIIAESTEGLRNTACSTV